VELKKYFCQGLEYPLKSFFHLELIPLDKTSISDPKNFISKMEFTYLASGYPVFFRCSLFLDVKIFPVFGITYKKGTSE